MGLTENRTAEGTLAAQERADPFARYRTPLPDPQTAVPGTNADPCYR